MNGELEGSLEGRSHGLNKVIFWNLPGLTEENQVFQLRFKPSAVVLLTTYYSVIMTF
jgi:hypothetical protein